MRRRGRQQGRDERYDIGPSDIGRHDVGGLRRLAEPERRRGRRGRSDGLRRRLQGRQGLGGGQDDRRRQRRPSRGRGLVLECHGPRRRRAHERRRDAGGHVPGHVRCEWRPDLEQALHRNERRVRRARDRSRGQHRDRDHRRPRQPRLRRRGASSQGRLGRCHREIRCSRGARLRRALRWRRKPTHVLRRGRRRR